MDIPIPTSILDFLVKQGGWPGICILGLLALVYALWKQNKALQDKNDLLVNKIDSLQEKRIVEGKEVLGAIHSSTSAIIGLTQVVGLAARRD